MENSDFFIVVFYFVPSNVFHLVYIDEWAFKSDVSMEKLNKFEKKSY